MVCCIDLTMLTIMLSRSCVRDLEWYAVSTWARAQVVYNKGPVRNAFPDDFNALRDRVNKQWRVPSPARPRPCRSDAWEVTPSQ